MRGGRPQTPSCSPCQLESRRGWTHSSARGGARLPFLKAGVDTVAAALPDARIVIMEGQQHIAIDLIPEVFADQLLPAHRSSSTPRTGPTRNRSSVWSG
jgi:hypothetical protein